MELDNETRAAIETLEKLAESYAAKRDRVLDTVRLLKGDSRIVNSAPESTPKLATHIYNNLGANVGKYSNIPVTGSVADRAISIIEAEGVFQTRQEVESIAKNIGNPFNTAISAALSGAKKIPSNELVMIRYASNLSYWGKRSWCDDDGYPLEQYIPKGIRTDIFKKIKAS